VQQLATVAGDREVDQAQALGLDGAFEQFFPVGVRSGVMLMAGFRLAPGQAALVLCRGQGRIDVRQQVADALAMLVMAGGNVADLLAVDEPGGTLVAQQIEQSEGLLAGVFMAW